MRISSILAIPCFFLISCQPGQKSETETKHESKTLEQFLTSQNYQRIALQKNNIGHFVIKGKVNGVDAIFILDTGASATCLDFESSKKFNLILKDISGSASGYGGDSQKIQTGVAIIEMGPFKSDSMQITAIDLTSVNQAYAAELKTRIDGVVGADILMKKNAVIDYATNSLYLKLN